MRRSVRKAIVLLLCAMLLTSVFAACGNNGPSEQTPAATLSTTPGTSPGQATPPEEDEFISLTLGVSSYLGGFITGGMSMADSAHACDAVFNAVWYVDPTTNEILSEILTDWHWEDDNTLVMTMRDDIVFSNGDKATSEDLLYSFTSLVDRGAVRWISNMKLISEESHIRDEYTVALAVSIKDELLFTAVTYLYNKNWGESVGWESMDWFYPVGSGPYYVHEYVPDNRIVLRLRDEYWLRPVTDFYVDEYVIQYYANPATMYMALEIGDIDINAAVGEADYRRFLDEGGDGFDIVGKASGVVSHLSFGFLNNEAWNNLLVRQAVAYGVPWDEFGELSYGATYYPATSFATHDSPLYLNVGRYEYNLEKAQELLAEAGYAPGELTVATFMQDIPPSVTQGEALKFYLDRIGFNSEFTFTEAWGQQLGSPDMDFGLHYNVRGSGTRNPTASLNMAGNKALPFLYIDNPKFQELYVPLSESFDKPASERMAMAHEIQQLVFDECLNIPIAELQVLFGYRTDKLSAQQILDCSLTNMNIYLSKLALKDNFQN